MRALSEALTRLKLECPPQLSPTVLRVVTEAHKVMLQRADLLRALNQIAYETRNIGSAHIIARAAIAKAVQPFYQHADSEGGEI